LGFGIWSLVFGSLLEPCTVNKSLKATNAIAGRETPGLIRNLFRPCKGRTINGLVRPLQGRKLLYRLVRWDSPDAISCVAFSDFSTTLFLPRTEQKRIFFQIFSKNCIFNLTFCFIYETFSDGCDEWLALHPILTHICGRWVFDNLRRSKCKRFL
jgi:hypothetical protein